MNINQQNLLISRRFRKKSLKIVNNPDFFENRVNSYNQINKDMIFETVHFIDPLLSITKISFSNSGNFLYNRTL